MDPTEYVYNHSLRSVDPEVNEFVEAEDGPRLRMVFRCTASRAIDAAQLLSLSPGQLQEEEGEMHTFIATQKRIDRVDFPQKFGNGKIDQEQMSTRPKILRPRTSRSCRGPSRRLQRRLPTRPSPIL